MKVYLDNQPYDLSESPETVQDLVGVIRPELAEQSRMIVTIQCDQQIVPDENIDKVLQRPAGDFERIDFATASIPQLAGDALQAALQMLGETRARQAEIVELLSAENIEKAIDVLSGCIESWAAAHASVVNTIVLLEINIDDLAHEGTSVLEILAQITHHLNELKACLTARDYVLLNDLMEYEIIPSFGQWEGMIKTLLEQVPAETT